jgi:transaldolase/glucose-6-phosphate isomerase
MASNPLLEIQKFGQSIWQDDIRRKEILNGKMQKRIDEDGIRGVTSNPKIFDKAIAGSRDYDADIRSMALSGKDIPQIYQHLTVRDVQMAADLFRPMYDRSEGKHGFVSLEVNPHLAHEVDGTIAEAHRLWTALDRPNVFIKVPATKEGLTSIRRLIADGINVNVTLLFGLPRYRKVTEAYINGLEDRLAAGESIERVASVASFFLSRIDVLVDPGLEKIRKNGGQHADLAERCHGRVALSSARKAYQIYKEIFHGRRFSALTEAGARTQRVLWASTSTKNPEYSDVKYVEALIGPETVNTLPQKTIEAYRDHGQPAERIEENLSLADEVMSGLTDLGIDIDQITQQLEDEGVEKFNKPYDSLMTTLEQQRTSALQEPVNGQRIFLAGYDEPVQKRIEQLSADDFVARLWQKDAGLWGDDADDCKVIDNALGWMDVPEKMTTHLKVLTDFAAEIREAGFTRVVHMGMGGSSLAPLTFQRTFAADENGPALMVLDTTDPDTIIDIRRWTDPAQTLFIVASKSGTTTEPLAFMAYFYEQVRAVKGENAGENFVAITDPGTPLVELGEKRGFRRIFKNYTDIGGRYSALSYFGLVPAALMGLDVPELLIRSLRMRHACSAQVPVEENPGVRLGAFLGQLAADGRDKVTFLVPPAVSPLGLWLEQLLAESTGKEGTGLLPVAGETPGYPEIYGNDRVFVHIRLKSEVDERLQRSVDRLKQAGQPVVEIEMTDRLDICQEFFRWEIATATAGAVLGINAFNQPNVQESKDNTRRLLHQVEDAGTLPAEKPAVSEDGLSFYGEAVQGAGTIAEGLKRFFNGSVKSGDYVAILSYLTEEAATDALIDDIRLSLQGRFKVAATMGYGPRYLHSTGQLHKGGPNKGIFLQLTADVAEDLDVPGKSYSFDVLRRAQAQGDLEALHKHGRRALRIHLGRDPGKGLVRLNETLKTVLAGGN